MPGERCADFERGLADAVDPAIASAEIASEFSRGADYVRVTVTLTVAATDVADALAIAWDAFRGAARDDLTSWEVTAAEASRSRAYHPFFIYPTGGCPRADVLVAQDDRPARRHPS